MANPSPALLLHVCCAPCASACIERLFEDKKIPVLYYSNSNIATEEEYEKRLVCVRQLAEYHDLRLIVDPYDHAAWRKHVSRQTGWESCPEGGKRCALCFEWSLSRTAAEAERLGMGFCTSLTVSPHKNSKMIFDIGGSWKHFEYYDFKKKDGFKRSIELSRRFGFYRQSFCGCEFSMHCRTEAASPRF